MNMEIRAASARLAGHMGLCLAGTTATSFTGPARAGAESRVEKRSEQPARRALHSWRPIIKMSCKREVACMSPGAGCFGTVGFACACGGCSLWGQPASSSPTPEPKDSSLRHCSLEVPEAMLALPAQRSPGGHKALNPGCSDIGRAHRLFAVPSTSGPE